MHILVATDGTLDPDAAAEAVARWHTEGDTVTVFTAMNIPSREDIADKRSARFKATNSDVIESQDLVIEMLRKLIH